MNSKANCHGRVKPTRVARICVLLPRGYKYLQAVLFFSHLEKRSYVCPCTTDIQEHFGCSCLCSLSTQAQNRGGVFGQSTAGDFIWVFQNAPTYGSLLHSLADHVFMPPNCIRLLIQGQQGCAPCVSLAVLALGVQNAPEGLRK